MNNVTRRRLLLAAGTPAWAATKRTMLWGDTSRRGRPFSKDPSVIEFGGRFLLYYSLPAYGDGRPGDGWAMGIAESRNLYDWRKVGEILPGAEYESKGLCAGNAIVLDGRVHLFYQTYGNGKRDAICHAVSLDGIRFERNPGNPVFRPTGTWNAGRAIDAEIVPHGQRLLLYCATRDPEMKVQMLTGAWAPLGSDFAPARWTQIGDGPILKPELPWERKCIEAPAVFRHDGRFYLFYAGGYNNEPQQIGCAVSDDGERYRRIFDEPFLTNGKAGDWNASESGHPGALTDRRGRTFLFYQGNPDGGKSYSLSFAEIGWKSGRPFLKR